jgi:hypothetical protein
MDAGIRQFINHHPDVFENVAYETSNQSQGAASYGPLPAPCVEGRVARGGRQGRHHLQAQGDQAGRKRERGKEREREGKRERKRGSKPNQTKPTSRPSTHRPLHHPHHPITTNNPPNQPQDDATVIHHRFPILELGVRRILAADHAGFALYGPGVSGAQGVEVRCAGGDGEVDKWISTMTWNQLVAGRKQAGVGSGRKHEQKRGAMER